MKNKEVTYLAPCFFCNVDSTELRVFVVLLIGSLVLLTVFTAVGLWLKGYFKNPERMNDYVLKIEGDEYERK